MNSPAVAHGPIRIDAARLRRTVMPCMFPEWPTDAAATASRFAAAGYKSLEFKTSGRIDDDLANLRAIRGAVPASFVVQADANRGYKDIPAFTEKHLAAYADGGLDIFEDPLEGSLADYAALRGKTPVKIMVDIAARSNNGVREVLLAGAADIVNQHPNQQGGYARSLLRACACELFGTAVWMGGTGTWAWATGSTWRRPVDSPSRPANSAAGSTTPSPTGCSSSTRCRRTASSPCPGGAGCGVELDDARMARFGDFDRTIRYHRDGSGFRRCVTGRQFEECE